MTNDELYEKIKSFLPRDFPFVLITPNPETGKGANIVSNQPPDVIQKVLIRASERFSPNMVPDAKRKYEE